MHIALAYFILVQSVNLLLLGQRCQGTYIADLGLAAGEHGGTMHSGDDIHLCCQRTDLRNRPPVRTFVILQDHLADCFLLILVYGFTQDCQPVLFLGKCLFQLCGDIPDILFPGLFVIRKYGYFHLLRGNQAPDLFKHFLRNGTAGVVMLGLANLRYDFINKCNNRLVDLVGLIDGLNHLRLRNLICSGFDHDHFLPGGCNGQVQVAVLPLFLGGIDDKHAVNHPHLGHGTGTVEGDVRNAGCNRGAQHGHQLRAAFRVHAHYHVVQCHVIAVILRKQRAHGPVNDTAGQNRILAGLALSLVEAAGNLPHSIHLLLKFHTQGKEIDSLPGFLGCGCGRKHHRIAVMHKRTSVGLFAHTVNVNLQRAPRQFHLISLIHRIFSSIPPSLTATSTQELPERKKIYAPAFP